MTTPPGPPIPTNFLIPADIVGDYLTGINIPDLTHPPYGFTGLMTVRTWSSSFYGEQVATGTVFLFPGNDKTDSPPPYCDPLYIKGEKTPPLNFIRHVTKPRHQLLCDLLDPTPTIPGFSQHFVGFSCKFPFWEPDQMGYRSNTCNPYWFGEDCDELPDTWRDLVYAALVSYLPAQPRTQISPKVQWNNTQMALTVQPDGSVSLERDTKSPNQAWLTVPGQTEVNGHLIFYLVNQYQLLTGNCQLFGDGTKGHPLTTGPFDPSNKNGQWIAVGQSSFWIYLYSQSGNGTLVMDSRSGSGNPGTVVQLYTTNDGPGQVWTFITPPGSK